MVHRFSITFLISDEVQNHIKSGTEKFTRNGSGFTEAEDELVGSDNLKLTRFWSEQIFFICSKFRDLFLNPGSRNRSQMVVWFYYIPLLCCMIALV